MSDSTVGIGLLLPEVLGTYGDSGNAQVLCKRLQWRGYDAEVVPVSLDSEVPSTLDLYLLGGGEDMAQVLAADFLRNSAGLRGAANAGRPVFGVCAGLQILGKRFRGVDGIEHAGLGLLDLVTEPAEQRAVAELIVEPNLLETPLTGFENHQGASVLGPGSAPLGRVVRARATATEPRARSPITCSAPISTARHWRAIPSWLTCCCRGCSAMR